ncbi:hypothetical protein OE88DRAFT_1069426 [Heliocybe sulcata]|uniref:Uncharacterized protein n=1 Tax=Heliocybe sulcata TaxID=5364 RepID=A0A5C3MPC8_9AGAM|nr:hypothetical protein OE88DRAFT_1069426 [Heliocybe sulcata]
MDNIGSLLSHAWLLLDGDAVVFGRNCCSITEHVAILMASMFFILLSLAVLSWVVGQRSDIRSARGCPCLAPCGLPHCAAAQRACRLRV